jgi:hypothetical protein
MAGPKEEEAIASEVIVMRARTESFILDLSSVIFESEG